MKQSTLIALSLGLMILAATVALAAGKVVVEAENYKSITPSMQKATSKLASGGAFLQVPLRRPHATVEGAPADEGKAVYSVNIPSAGTYRFWARTLWWDGCGNSFFLKIGSNPVVVLGQDGTYQTWHWVKGPLVQLPAGPVTVIIQNREDGAMIDQFMFNKDLKQVPVRAEK